LDSAINTWASLWSLFCLRSFLSNSRARRRCVLHCKVSVRAAPVNLHFVPSAPLVCTTPLPVSLISSFLFRLPCCAAPRTA
jgi:hypothetical protein